MASWPDDDRTDDGIDSTIAPDLALGVTLLHLVGDASVASDDLDPTAAALSAALPIEELVRSIHPRSTAAGAGG